MKPMQNFLRIVEQFHVKYDNVETYQEIHREYSLQTLKIKKLFVEKLLCSYGIRARKYRNKQISNLPDDWHKNQRKLFVQFLLCYCKIKNSTPESLTQAQWQDLSQIFFDKNPMLLKFQGLSIQKYLKKISWENADDTLVRTLVEDTGEKNWNQISKKIYYSTHFQKYFSPKQIRERWFNHLSQNVKHGSWQAHQDLIILEHVARQNKRWCEIKRKLKYTRTEHMIRNRYKFLLKAPATTRQMAQPKELKQSKRLGQVISNIKRRIQRMNQQKTKLPILSESEKGQKMLASKNVKVEQFENEDCCEKKEEQFQNQNLMTPDNFNAQLPQLYMIYPYSNPDQCMASQRMEGPDLALLAADGLFLSVVPFGNFQGQQNNMGYLCNLWGYTNNAPGQKFEQL